MNRPVRTPYAESSAVDHCGGRGLAVRTGNVNRRVGMLRVPHEVESGLDSVESRFDLRLGSAPDQLDLEGEESLCLVDAICVTVSRCHAGESR